MLTNPMGQRCTVNTFLYTTYVCVLSIHFYAQHMCVYCPPANTNKWAVDDICNGQHNGVTSGQLCWQATLTHMRICQCVWLCVWLCVPLGMKDIAYSLSHGCQQLLCLC